MGRSAVSLLVVLVSAAALATETRYTVTVDLTRDIHALGKDDVLREGPAWRRLTGLGDAAVPALADALRSEPATVRAGVAEVLAEIGTHATLDPLLSASRDQDATVRAAALEGLLSRTDARVDAAVARALDDPDPQVRLAGVHGCIAHCHDVAALERLVDVAIRDPAPVPASHARSAVTVLLADADERRTMIDARIAAIAPPLLSDPPTITAVRAALLLSDIGRRDGLPVLCAAIGRSDLLNLPLHAIVALGAHGDATAVSPVSKELYDGDRTIQLYAAASLEEMAARAIPGAADALAKYTGPRAPGGKLPPLP